MCYGWCQCWGREREREKERVEGGGRVEGGRQVSVKVIEGKQSQDIHS